MIFLSIVIPVYNVEAYIKDCIDSCVENIAALSKNVEIIVVNDGTKDNSMHIVEDITSGLDYVKIISQENMGLSMARNNGLKEAKGKYVWFVDSDDYLPIGILDTIINTLEQNKDIDILDLSYKRIDEYEKRIKDFVNKDIKANYSSVISGKERFVSGFNVPVQFHVFRTDFLKDNDLRMYPGIYHEDGEFTPRAIWMASRLVVLNDISYYYRTRRNSILTTVNPKKGVDNVFVARRLQLFFNEQPMLKKERDIANEIISMYFCNGLNNAVGASTVEKRMINNAVIENIEVLEILKHSLSFKYRLLGYLGLIFPRHVTFIYLMLLRLK